MQRSALKQALAGRNEEELKPILVFVAKHIINPLYASLLIDVGSCLLDLYGSVIGQSPEVDALFLKLHLKLKTEVDFQERLLELMGSMDALLASRERI